MEKAVKSVRLQPGRKTLWMLLGIAAVLAAALLVVVHHSMQASARASRSPSESFNSDDWLALGGSWTPHRNEIENATLDRGAKLIHRAPSLADFSLDVDLKMERFDGEAGVLVRSSDEEEGVDALHGYFIGLQPVDSAAVLIRKDYGAEVLQKLPLPFSTDFSGWFHLHIAASGCQLGVTITPPDGAAHSFQYKDQDCLRKGHIGLTSSSSETTWKNLEFHPLLHTDPDALLHSSSTTPADNWEEFAAANQETLLRRSQDAYAKEASYDAVAFNNRLIDSYPRVPGTYPNADVRGMVISNPPVLQIQDSSRAITIEHFTSKVPIKVGDFVEASGTIVCLNFWCEFSQATIRVLWSTNPSPPLAVTASQLTDGLYRGLSIAIEGTLISAKTNGQGFEMILTDGEYRFRAIGSTSYQMKLPTLATGSRIRLYGLASSRVEYAQGIYPFAVIAENVEVLNGPPFWTTTHILWMLFALLLLFLLVLAAIRKLQIWHTHSLLRERERMALEMHDTLAQSFTGIAYQLQAAARDKNGLEQMRDHLTSALGLVKHSHREVSKTISSLRPQHRDAHEIVESLRAAATRLSDGESIFIRGTFLGHNRVLPLPITDALFRIGQEAISNAMLHSSCTQLKIELILTSRSARLDIEDDGCGFNPAAQQCGMGLAGMQRRAANINAELTIRSSPQAGTRITVQAALPLLNALHSLFGV
jgi:signal transduction histidine kinase